MFTSLILNTKKGETINKYTLDNVVFKQNIFGFKYNYFNKKTLINPNSKCVTYKFINNINIPTYEVLGTNTPTKIYLDCELEDLRENIYNIKNNMIFTFNNYLIKFLKNKYPNKDFSLFYSDASRSKNNGNYKVSLHVIINNLGYFNDRNKLKMFIIEFSKTLPDNLFVKNGKSFVDSDVYHSTQLMRITFSPNKDKDSVFKPFIIHDNEIIHKDKTFVSENYSDTLCGYYNNNTKLSCLDDDIILKNINKKITQKVNTDDDIILKNINKKITQKVNTDNDILVIPKWKIDWVNNSVYVKGIYKIIDIIDNKIRLERIQKNVFCKICNRNHENDNSFVRVYKNNIMFYCNRHNKGISIGSWYNKERQTVLENTINNDNDSLKKQNILLKNKINILEKEIKRLEDNIIVLNKFNEVKPNKFTKNEYKNKNKNLFIKYYEVGELLYNSTLDNVNTYIGQHFKCGNISVVKNRSIRIYKLYKYLKDNNLEKITSSLRNIFNTPNWKFDEDLKSKVFFL